MSIILDLIGISWLLLLVREEFKKGHITLACILGILYSCIMMILAVPGPKWIFITVSMIFVCCTCRLILNEYYNKWKDFWIEQSNDDGIERNLSFLMFLWVKIAYHFIERHKPSKLSNFEIPETPIHICEPLSTEPSVDNDIGKKSDEQKEISKEDMEDQELVAPESTDILMENNTSLDNVPAIEEEIDLSLEAVTAPEPSVSDEFVDL